MLLKLYFIGYDLRKDRDYKKLTDELERMGAKRILLSDWHYSQFGTNCTQIRDHLIEFLDEDDRLVVSQIGGIEPDWATFNAKSTPNDNLSS